VFTLSDTATLTTPSKPKCVGAYKEPNPFENITSIYDRLSSLEDIASTDRQGANIPTLMLLALSQQKTSTGGSKGSALAGQTL